MSWMKKTYFLKKYIILYIKKNKHICSGKKMLIFLLSTVQKTQIQAGNNLNRTWSKLDNAYTTVYPGYNIYRMSIIFSPLIFSHVKVTQYVCEKSKGFRKKRNLYFWNFGFYKNLDFWNFGFYKNLDFWNFEFFGNSEFLKISISENFDFWKFRFLNRIFEFCRILICELP